MEKKEKKQKPKAEAPMLIDATGAVVGRLSAVVAKKSLNGAKIDIVNIEKAIMTGRPSKIIERYQKRRHMTQKSNPEEAAKWPRRPDYLFKTILKGMLPKRTSRTKDALGRVMAYIGVPAQFEGKPAEKFAKKEAAAGITMQKLSRELGWVANK